MQAKRPTYQRATPAVFCFALKFFMLATTVFANDVTMGRNGSLLLSVGNSPNFSTPIVPPMSNPPRVFSWPTARRRNTLPSTLAIVGGSPADAMITRRHAFLNIFHYNPPATYFCGGTILTEYVVLSAAHCFFRPGSYNSTEGVLVFAGESEQPFSDRIYAARVYIHKDYAFNDSEPVETYENDIAVLVLASPIPPHKFDRMTVAMSWLDMPSGGETVWAAGFGHTTFNGRLSNQLLQTQLTRQYFQPCVKAEPAEYQALVDRSSLICATSPGFPDVGGNDSCNGDSGGPLYWYRQADGDIVQIGITSWGSTGCAEKGTVAWYTRVKKFASDLQALFKATPDTSSWVVYPPQGDEDPGVRPEPSDES